MSGGVEPEMIGSMEGVPYPARGRVVQTWESVYWTPNPAADQPGEPRMLAVQYWRRAREVRPGYVEIDASYDGTSWWFTGGSMTLPPMEGT